VGWGKNIRQRAEALTGIAHPDFRAGLLAAAGLGAGTALLHDLTLVTRNVDDFIGGHPQGWPARRGRRGA
jgi:hypothetical protein